MSQGSLIFKIYAIGPLHEGEHMKKAEQFSADVGDFVEKMLTHQREYEVASAARSAAFETALVAKLKEFQRGLLERQEAFEAATLDGVRGIVEMFTKQSAATNSKAAEVITALSEKHAQLAAVFEAFMRTHGGPVN
jgi:hypothetical protein